MTPNPPSPPPPARPETPAADAMSDDELAELERLEKRATHGPWECFGGSLVSWDDDGSLAMEWVSNGGDNAAPDGPLMAAARNALPRLLAEVRALRAAAPSPASGATDGGEVRAALRKAMEALRALRPDARQGFPYEPAEIYALGWDDARSEASRVLSDAIAAAVSSPPDKPGDAGGWVSVEERLPERGVPVLAYNGDKTAVVWLRWADSQSSRSWSSIPGEWSFHPTYWRPLPLPPPPGVAPGAPAEGTEVRA